MIHEFERCNSCFVFNGLEYVEGDGYDIFNKQEKYILAGLKPDYENDLYIREGYGALCFGCGEYDDLENVIETAIAFENFYNFPEKIMSGYKFVIGPGVNIEYQNGNVIVNDYAVYCVNYKKILEDKWKMK